MEKNVYPNLGHISFYWSNSKKYTEYKNIYADFDYKRSGRSTAGTHSYIGIYGWARNQNTQKAEDKLVEYYIVEDWFGNQWQEDASPISTNTTGAL